VTLLTVVNVLLVAIKGVPYAYVTSDDGTLQGVGFVLNANNSSSDLDLIDLNIMSIIRPLNCIHSSQGWLSAKRRLLAPLGTTHLYRTIQ